jgi:hypothetical protein
MATTTTSDDQQPCVFPEDDAVAEEVLSRLDYRSAARAASTCRLFRRAFANPKVRK